VSTRETLPVPRCCGDIEAEIASAFLEVLGEEHLGCAVDEVAAPLCFRVPRRIRQHPPGSSSLHQEDAPVQEEMAQGLSDMFERSSFKGE
jgi:hypothetical protein